MPTCQGKTKNGHPCSRNVKNGVLYCWQHKPHERSARMLEADGEPWPEVYEHLADAMPEEKTDIVLRLIEEHPEGRLELPERDGMRADLRGVDLSNETVRAKIEAWGDASPPWWNPKEKRANLQNADLRSANLEDANLSGAYLRFVNLQGAFLKGAIIRSANLVDANLQGAVMEGADLRGAVLWDANFRDTYLLRADLRNARLGNAQLQGAHLSRTDLQKADLRLAKLQRAKLWGTRFQDADLQHAKLREADPVMANFQGADLRNAELQGIDLSDCDITHVYLSGAWLDRTRLRWEQVGEKVGEELDSRKQGLSAKERARTYSKAKLVYMVLKQNFESFGDYEAASLAYRRERCMEKLEALLAARVAVAEHKWQVAIANSKKVAFDQFVEIICDYGEDTKRVVVSLGIVWIGFALIYFLIAGVWGPWHDTDWGQARYVTRNPIDMLSFSLAAIVTHELPGLEARSTLFMRILIPFEALLGIFLAGLLGFVAGNRIRRS